MPEIKEWHRYDADNYYYVSIRCRLQPGNSTDVPPVFERGYWPQWPVNDPNATAWGRDEDHRERTLAAGFPPEAVQEATQYWMPGDTWQTPARAMTQVGPLPEGAMLTQPAQTFDDARAAKYAEIIAGANAVKAALSSRFSVLEEATWPEQEAGARAILNDAANVKDKTARLILLDESGTANAVALVHQLAATDGTTPEEFAARIIANADLSYQAGVLTLLEQRAMEAHLAAAQTVAEVQAIVVVYSAMPQAGDG